MEEITTPRKIKTQQTRKAIFEAARDLVREHGADYLTVKNVCAKAGVSNGTFFYHFPNVEALLSYYLQEGYQDYLAEHRDEKLAGIPADDFGARVKAWATLYTDYCVAAGPAFVGRFYSTSNELLDTRTRRPTADMGLLSFSSIDEIFAAGKTAGYIREGVDVTGMWLDCITVIKGSIFEWCLAQGGFDLSALVRHILDLLFNGITTEKYRQTYGGGAQHAG